MMTEELKEEEEDNLGEYKKPLPPAGEEAAALLPHQTLEEGGGQAVGHLLGHPLTLSLYSLFGMVGALMLLLQPGFLLFL